MTSELLEKDKLNENLASALKKLAKTVDLSKPLVNLADTLKDGGNLGAHFDLDKEPDEATAKALLDFIEYLLEYLFVLPRQIEDLRDRIS